MPTPWKHTSHPPLKRYCWMGLEWGSIKLQFEGPVNSWMLKVLLSSFIEVKLMYSNCSMQFDEIWRIYLQFPFTHCLSGVPQMLIYHVFILIQFRTFYDFLVDFFFVSGRYLEAYFLVFRYLDSPDTVLLLTSN